MVEPVDYTTIAIRTRDKRLVSKLMTALNERDDIRWSKGAVWKLALYRGLMSIAAELGINL